MTKEEVLNNISTSINYILSSIRNKIESLMTITDTQLRMKTASVELASFKVLRDDMSVDLCRTLVDNTKVLVSKDMGDIVTMSRGLEVSQGLDT